MILPFSSSVKSSTRLALIALLSGAVGIAIAPILVRLSPVGPSATAFWRVLLALPLLWAWSGFHRGRLPLKGLPASAADYGQLFLAGWFFAVDLSLWHWSIKLTSVANATLLVNFAPVFVTLGSWLIFHQRIRSLFLLGMALALAGMALIAGHNFQVSLRFFWGDALSFSAALFYAGYLLSIKTLRERFATSTIMAWSGLSAATTLLVISCLTGESLFFSGLRGWAVLLALAMVSQAAGQSLITYALAQLPAAFSSVALLFQPLTAAVLAWILLDEPVRGWQAYGGFLVLMGIAVARRGSSEK
jgi:drug/metabolite transporter (DMT)-like permease